MSREVDVQNEIELAKLLDDNNSLEKSYLKQLYQHIHKDRPQQIRNIFAEIEEEVFKDDNMMNSDFLIDSIRKNNSELASIQDEIDQLSNNVDDQRQNLHSIICEIDENHVYEENSTLIEEPDKECSPQVQDLVREIAYSIDEVNEDDLVQYLARGPARQSEQEVLNKVNDLCAKRYELNQLKITNRILRRLNDEINSLQNSEHRWEQNVSPNPYDFEQLSNAFDNAATNISKIASKDQSDGESEFDYNWIKLQQMSKEIKDARDQLFNTIKSENEIPLPKEFTLPEKEKEALKQTLNSLIESNRLLTDYLQKIREHGIVESMIYPPEEVREIFDQYNELKQRSHELL